jgi:carbamoyl-phosphate synthase large subunit
MGVSTSTALAFGKALVSAGTKLPSQGKAFISVQTEDKEIACHLARRLRNLGFSIVATRGTAETLRRARIPAERINKVLEGGPHIVDAIREGEIALVINTTHGEQAIRDSYSIRRNALLASIPYFTTIAAGVAAVDAMEANSLIPRGKVSGVRSIQEWHFRSAQAADLPNP